MSEQPVEKPYPPTVVTDLGQVARVSIPFGWTGLQSHEMDDRIVRVWQYEKEPRVRFVSYERNGELSFNGAGAFTRILYDEFHNLNRPELDTLEELLEAAHKRDNFEISAAYTSYLNNRRMLRLDGTWKRDNISSIGIWIDADGKGRRVQQLAFLAPKDIFEAYFAEAQDIFESIRWKA
jgi:hypothetical protein